MEKLIEIRNVAVSYDAKPVLRDVSLDVWERDFLGVVGPNGGGKTTLLKVILGLLKPSSGTVAFFRNGRRAPSLPVGYLPQISPVDRRFPISVGEMVASGLMTGANIFKRPTSSEKTRIGALLAEMGLEHLSDRAIGELSGGQLQRALLARAIVSSPPLLVLDEPNTFIDKQFEAQFHELLGRLNRDTAIILVSHDAGTLIPMVKNVARVHETLQYQSGAAGNRLLYNP